MQPAVFLDRDNTLIANDGDLGDPEKVRLMDGVATGLRSLREAGFRLVVVTNQGGVARGKYTEEDVDTVNQRIAELIEQAADFPNLIDRFYYCPYDPKATVEEYRRDHPWRKPHPGMMLQAARDLRIDLCRSWMVGDQTRDVIAGRAAGCRTILIDNGADGAGETKPSALAESFAQAVDIIVNAERSDKGGWRSRESSAAMRDAPAAARADAHGAGVSFSASGPEGGSEGELKQIRRIVSELAEQIRIERLQRLEFTPLKLLAGIVQLLVVLFVMLGLLQLAHTEVFLKWMAGAALLQLITITILLVDMQR